MITGDGILAQSVQTIEKTLKGQEDAGLSAIFEQRKQRKLDLAGTKRAKSVLPSMANLENIPPPKLTMDEFRLCVHNGGFRLASETSSHGGNGAVYKASKHSSLHTYVAIKTNSDRC